MKKKRALNVFYNINGWGFISVALILLLILNVYPIISSFLLSFQTGKGVVYHFNGLGNIKRLLSDKIFLVALKNTFIYFIFQVPIMTLIALALASILNNSNLKFKGFFRTAIFLPCVTSLIAYSILFKSLFANDGVINNFLIFTHIISNPIPWLQDPFWAKITIILSITWRWTGYNMIFFLAGLQNINASLYEAAEIDGASKIRQFFSITIPMLTPIILFTSIMSTIGTLQLFDDVYSLTKGGPGNATITLSMYIYNLCFKFTPNFGYAATVSYVIVFFVAILAWIQIKVAGDKNESK